MTEIKLGDRVRFPLNGDDSGRTRYGIGVAAWASDTCYFIEMDGEYFQIKKAYCQHEADFNALVQRGKE